MKLRRKKIILLGLAMIMLFALTACDNSGGTYYPNCSEMENNLKKAGYKVEVTTELDNNCAGTKLCGTKGDEYIVFYWLDNEEDVKYFSDKLEKEYPSYNKFVSMTDDEKFGSLVFRGTEKAVEKSGIKIVKVKVK